MSIEQNEQIVRRFYEALNQTDPSTINEAIAHYVASDVVVHDPFLGTLTGVDAYRQIVHSYLTAFPEQKVIVDKIVANGDCVAVLHTHIATNSGSFMGAPPTGKRVTFGGLELIRLDDGKIVEFWRHDDDAGLMRQLGPLFVVGSAWQPLLRRLRNQAGKR